LIKNIIKKKNVIISLKAANFINSTGIISSLFAPKINTTLCHLYLEQPSLVDKESDHQAPAQFFPQSPAAKRGEW